MALLFTDSFDDRDIDHIGDRYNSFQYNVGAGSAIYSGGRTGKALVLSTGVLDQVDRATWQSASTHQTLYLGVATKSSLSTALCSIRYNGTPHIYVQLNDDYTLSVIRFGTPETTLFTSSRTVSLTDWFYVEFMGKIDPTNGAYELRVDGVRWSSASGINTSATGGSLANQVRLTYNHIGTDGATRVVDDFYIVDDDTVGGTSHITGFLGPVHIGLIEENGNGALSEWVPHGGTNYENVDETTGEDGDTTYNGGETHHAIDLYTLTDLEVVNPTIKAVAVHQWARKEDALYRGFVPTARVNATDYFGTEEALGATYERVFYTWENNPSTGLAWNTSDINLLQVGARTNFSS